MRENNNNFFIHSYGSFCSFATMALQMGKVGIKDLFGVLPDEKRHYDEGAIPELYQELHQDRPEVMKVVRILERYYAEDEALPPNPIRRCGRALAIASAFTMRDARDRQIQSERDKGSVSAKVLFTRSILRKAFEQVKSADLAKMLHDVIEKPLREWVAGFQAILWMISREKCGFPPPLEVNAALFPVENALRRKYMEEYGRPADIMGKWAMNQINKSRYLFNRVVMISLHYWMPPPDVVRSTYQRIAVGIKQHEAVSERMHRRKVKMSPQERMEQVILLRDAFIEVIDYACRFRIKQECLDGFMRTYCSTKLSEFVGWIPNDDVQPKAWKLLKPEVYLA